MDSSGQFFGINQEMEIFTFDRDAYRNIQWSKLNDLSILPLDMALKNEKFTDGDQLKRLIGMEP